MTTKREQILARIVSNLANTVGVGNRIYRSRIEPLTRSETPAIVVEFVDDTAEMSGSLPYLNWRLTVQIMVIARGLIPDQLADPTVKSLHAKLMADITLNNLAFDILPVSQTFQIVESDQPTGIVSCLYAVRYRTSLTTLE